MKGSVRLTSGYTMSFKERQKIRTLVVEPNQRLRQVVRNALQDLGYGSVYCVSEHSAGLVKLEEDDFTHVFYDANSASPGVIPFVEKAFELNFRLILIAISENPEVDQIFAHLQRGVRGFITKPITTDMIDQSMLHATLGQPFSETILSAKDRNQAFSALLAATVGKAATARRQARRSPGAKRDAERYMQDLEATSHLVQTFCEGGQHRFMETMIDFFVELAEGPSTRLGSLRRRLSDQRGDGSEAELLR